MVIGYNSKFKHLFMNKNFVLSLPMKCSSSLVIIILRVFIIFQSIAAVICSYLKYSGANKDILTRFVIHASLSICEQLKIIIGNWINLEENLFGFKSCYINF